MKKFNILNVSSKFAICGLPVRADTYKTCEFACKYCFANYRKVMEFKKELAVGNLVQFRKYLENVEKKDTVSKDDFLGNLLKQRITWHCGGMSDPFQPVEKELGITKDMINIARGYGYSILFSTKADTVYDCNISPEFHSFQLSVTNVDNRTDIEPNVPSIEKRLAFFNDLKADGFKVGIRVQPFIPGVTDSRIVDMFSNADYFTIEGLKIVPQNKEHKQLLFNLFKLNSSHFKQMGLLNLKPEIRNELYTDMIKKLTNLSIPFSIADNDMHYISSGKCCCGDTLIKKSTDFNTTAMLQNNLEYTLDDVKNNLGVYKSCKCNQLFTSNRTNGCTTVLDFYNERFNKKSSPFSPKFLWKAGE